MDKQKQRIAIAKSLGWSNKPGNIHLWDLPEWTIDLNAAVGLCDELRSSGTLVILSRMDDGRWACELYDAEHREGIAFLHKAPTLAEAICGAYLKAKGLWVESPKKDDQTQRRSLRDMGMDSWARMLADEKTTTPTADHSEP